MFLKIVFTKKKKLYLLWNGEDERGVQAWNQRPTRRLLVQVGNDEGLDDSGSSGGRESLDLKYIFKVQPAGLTNSLDAGHEGKKKSQEWVLARITGELELPFYSVRETGRAEVNLRALF